LLLALLPIFPLLQSLLLALRLLLPLLQSLPPVPLVELLPLQFR
jgi:hypothetical protein